MWRRSGYHFLFSSMFFLSPWDKSNLTTSPIVSTATIHNPSRECANSEIHSIKVLRENHHPSGTFPLKVTLTSAKLFSNFYKEGILSSVQFSSTFLIEVKIFQFRFKIIQEASLISDRIFTFICANTCARLDQRFNLRKYLQKPLRTHGFAQIFAII